MYRKISIIILLFFTLLCSGCEMNNLNNNKNTTKLATSDIKQLIGITYNDIEKIYGSPEKSTYYINKNNLSKIQKNYISLRSFNYHSIIKAYYKTTVEDKYIILWYKNNKVIKACFDEDDIISKDSFSSSLNNKYNLEEYKTSIKDSIFSFNKKHNLSCPKIAVNFSSSNKVLYFYHINKSKNEYDNDCLFIISNNNKITYINTINSSKICETILEYIK